MVVTDDHIWWTTYLSDSNVQITTSTISRTALREMLVLARKSY